MIIEAIYMRKKLFLLVITFTIVIGMISPVYENVWAKGKETVYIIPVEGEITPAMAAFFKKSIQNAEIVNVDAILVELSTFGGRVDAALEIKETIEHLKYLLLYILGIGQYQLVHLLLLQPQGLLWHLAVIWAQLSPSPIAPRQ